jgi:hypothetical protein
LKAEYRFAEWVRFTSPSALIKLGFVAQNATPLQIPFRKKRFLFACIG